MNAHWAKTLAIAEGEVGDSEPLWQGGTWLVATMHDLHIVSE